MAKNKRGISGISKTSGSDNIQFTLQPSQWVNFPYYVAALAAFLLFREYFWVWWSALALAFWNTIVVANIVYEFRQRTIMERSGVFSVSREEVNVYRVKSVKVEQPFWLRLVGLTNISIVSNEAYKPYLLLHAIPQGEAVSRFVKDSTFSAKTTMGVRDMDLFNAY